MKTLTQIQQEYNFKTDKNSPHTYFNVYEELFSPYRDLPINILEIGILAGESLKLWSSYFVNANIVGIDTFTRVSFNDVHQNLTKFKNVTIYNIDSFGSDEYSRARFLEINNNIKFDIIIDDGNHTSHAQLHTFNNFSSMLNNNGIYIIEDIRDHDGHLNNIIDNIPDMQIVNMNYAHMFDNILGVYRK